MDYAEALWLLEGDARESNAFLVGVVKGWPAHRSKPEVVRAVEILERIGPAAKETVPVLLAAIQAEKAASGKEAFSYRRQRLDDEEHEIDANVLVRHACIKALRRIDPEAAKRAETGSGK
jgi:hypothetical protein